MWLFIHRPFEVWPVLGTLRVERVYMVLAIVYWALMAKKQWLSNPLQWANFAFTFAVIFCWMLSPWSAEERPHLIVENYLKQFVFYILLMSSVGTEADLKKICVGFVWPWGCT